MSRPLRCKISGNVEEFEIQEGVLVKFSPRRQSRRLFVGGYAKHRNRTGIVAVTHWMCRRAAATRDGAGVSWSGYKSLAVAPAANETGQKFDFDFVGAFTEDLKSALMSKGYDVSDSNASPPEALIVESSFVSYAPGNAFQRWLLPGWGTTQATVKTTLVGKKTGKAVGDMVTTKQVAGGLFGGVGAYSSILESVASDVATAIDNKIKGS